MTELHEQFSRQLQLPSQVLYPQKCPANPSAYQHPPVQYPLAHGTSAQYNDGQTCTNGGLGEHLELPENWNPRMSMCVTSTKGLLNAPGQNNCFMNSAVQVLWQLDVFRRCFRQIAGHYCIGDSCIFCALKVIFTQFRFSDKAALPPDNLRLALAEAFADDRRFQLGHMDDAAECFENILRRLHLHVTNERGDEDCGVAHCIAHRKFSMTVVEQVICRQCGSQSKPMPFTQLVRYVPTTALCGIRRQLSQLGHSFSFSFLLQQAGAEEKTCPRGCGSGASVQHRLTSSPDVVTIGFIWESERPSSSHVAEVLDNVGTELSLLQLFTSVSSASTPGNSCRRLQLVGVVCYYGKHYTTFFRHLKLGTWIHFDDANVVEIGSDWSQVRERCKSSRFQPLLLFYANPEAGPLDITAAPTTKVMVEKPAPPRPSGRPPHRSQQYVGGPLYPQQHYPAHVQHGLLSHSSGIPPPSVSMTGVPNHMPGADYNPARLRPEGVSGTGSKHQRQPSFINAISDSTDTHPSLDMQPENREKPPSATENGGKPGIDAVDAALLTAALQPVASKRTRNLSLRIPDTSLRSDLSPTSPKSNSGCSSKQSSPKHLSQDDTALVAKQSIMELKQKQQQQQQLRKESFKKPSGLRADVIRGWVQPDVNSDVNLNSSVGSTGGSSTSRVTQRQDSAPVELQRMPTQPTTQVEAKSKPNQLYSRQVSAPVVHQTGSHNNSPNKPNSARIPAYPNKAPATPVTARRELKDSAYISNKQVISLFEQQHRLLRNRKPGVPSDSPNSSSDAASGLSLVNDRGLNSSHSSLDSLSRTSSSSTVNKQLSVSSAVSSDRQDSGYSGSDRCSSGGSADIMPYTSANALTRNISNMPATVTPRQASYPQQTTTESQPSQHQPMHSTGTQPHRAAFNSTSHSLLANNPLPYSSTQLPPAQRPHLPQHNTRLPAQLPSHPPQPSQLHSHHQGQQRPQHQHQQHPAQQRQQYRPENEARLQSLFRSADQLVTQSKEREQLADIQAALSLTNCAVEELRQAVSLDGISAAGRSAAQVRYNSCVNRARTLYRSSRAQDNRHQRRDSSDALLQDNESGRSRSKSVSFSDEKSSATPVSVQTAARGRQARGIERGSEGPRTRSQSQGRVDQHHRTGSQMSVGGSSVDSLDTQLPVGYATLPRKPRTRMLGGQSPSHSLEDEAKRHEPSQPKSILKTSRSRPPVAPKPLRPTAGQGTVRPPAMQGVVRSSVTQGTVRQAQNLQNNTTFEPITHMTVQHEAETKASELRTSNSHVQIRYATEF